jgi:predicted nucleic acid-binding protein
LIIYADTSALLKRVLDEAESDQLDAQLEAWQAAGDQLVSSALSWLEVARTLRANFAAGAAGLADAADVATAGVAEIEITSEILGLARIVGPAELRSLDAVHCATASVLDVDLVLSYDKRMLDASDGLMISTLSPGW